MAAPHDPTRSGSPASRATASIAALGQTKSAADQAATTGDDPSPILQAPPASTERYQFGDEIARGGMGVVYQATDTVLDRVVAVKILSDRFGATSLAARRFADEARITGKLQHPAIPPVHDLGVLSDGRPFLAMKLVKGDTLEILLKNRPNPAYDRGRFIAVFESVCQALAYTHSRHVIHRDLKPANVMVGNFGEVQVMDWGLAKVLGTGTGGGDANETAAETEIRSLREFDGSATHAGSVLGTPAFMPPEQAIGAIGKIDTRSDVFGLGAILAVILTAKPPFASSSAETTRIKAAQGKVEECFDRLDSCGADPEWVILAKRCLAPAPADRPVNAGEVARTVAELRQAADDRARCAELDRVKSEGEKAAAKFKVAEQRKRRRVQFLFVFWVLMLTAGVLVLLAESGIKQAEFDAEQARVHAEREIEQARADADRRVSRQGVEAAIKLAVNLREQYKFREAGDALAQAEKLAAGVGEAELRAKVEKEKADLAFVAELDGIECSATEGTIDENMNWIHDYSAPARNYPAVFKAHGFDFVSGDPADLAARLKASSIKPQLVSALDHWASSEEWGKKSGPQIKPNRVTELGQWIWPEEWAKNGPGSALRILEVLRRVDPGPWQNRFRDPVVRNDRASMYQLAREIDWDAVPPGTIVALTDHPMMMRSPAAVALLRAALSRHPNSFPIAIRLYWNLLLIDGNAAYPYLLVAHALRPDSVGLTLWLAPKMAEQSGDTAAAVLMLREIERTRRLSASEYGMLGTLLSNSGQAEALPILRRAADIYPESGHIRLELGKTLQKAGDLPGAIVELREAIHLGPGFARQAVLILIDILKQQGNRDGMIQLYKDLPELGLAQFYEHDMNDFLSAQDDPAWVLKAAAQLREGAGISPAAWRSVAARQAIRAGTGQGPNPPPASDCPSLRRQALEWLHDEVAEWRRSFTDPHLTATQERMISTWTPAQATKYRKGLTAGFRQTAHTQTIRLLTDPAFASLRDPFFLISLPSEEVKEWLALWAEVGALRDETTPAVVSLTIAPPPRALETEFTPLFATAAAAHNDLGVALRDAGHIDEAVREFEAAAALDRKYALPHRNLAWIYWYRHVHSHADAEWREAIRLAPTNAEYLADFGDFLQASGKFAESLQQYEEAFKVAPWLARPANAQAWILATCPDAGCRNGKRAIELATKACEITKWGEPNFIDTLAAAYAEAGEFDKAEKYQKMALTFPAFEKAEGQAARSRVELYQGKKAYHLATSPAVAPPPRDLKR